MTALSDIAFDLLERIRERQPVVHHMTNWVTIYDCANVVKVLGGSPIMAHAPEEAREMTGIASALVLNIGTLTVELVEAMKKSALCANEKGIPVVLDACGAGASKLRDQKCFELLDKTRIAVIKGNASEVARLAGEAVKTKGVDAGEVQADLRKLAADLAGQRDCTVVITGQEDIISDGKNSYLVRNGDPMMGRIVGTGCMAASVIGTFVAVEADTAYAAAAGLVCYEVAAELATATSQGPGTFKEMFYDALFNLDRGTVAKMQKLELIEGDNAD
jgi:hydroxyethylthiazole kinase